MESIHSTEISDLPNEMLEEIFNFLKDPNDFLRVIGTCPRWNDIMSYRKTERLFGKVFPILLKYNLVPLRTMLTLRLISKKWKQEAELELEQDPSRLMRKYNIGDAEQVNQLLIHATNLPQGCNPFIGKHLSITSGDPVAYDSMHQLIQQHGTHLKSIEMKFFSKIQFASFLGGIPNVETLSIIGLMQQWETEDEADAPPLLPLLRLNNLGIAIYGAIHRDQNDDYRFLRLLSFLFTAYGQQLATLTCPKQLLRIGGISDLLPNLRQLELFMPHISSDAYTQPDLQVLSQVEWRLHTLSIYEWNFPLTTEFMTALNNFSATLEDLKIFIQLEENFDPDSLASFPFLKKLYLGITSELRSIPLGMKYRLMKLGGVAPNLEELDINLRNEALCDIVWSMEVMSNVFQNLNLIRLRGIPCKTFTL
ncbi:unnamed protein product [Orchesella dallaii]|uniref:F-box domain-containing protein n=1 Tax=Orchesella dallaii TaxID=48710 RepID=A0ABP1QF77_9HEXA